MKKKIVVYVFCLVLVFAGLGYLILHKPQQIGRTSGYGVQITPENALQIVTARVYEDENLKKMFPRFHITKSADVKALKQDGELIGYVVDLGLEGYVVVSPTNELTPIIAYAAKPFDYDSFYADDSSYTANPLYKFMRKDLAARKRALEENVIPYESINKSQSDWDYLLQKANEISGTKNFQLISWLKNKINRYAWAQGVVSYWPAIGETATGGWVETEWNQFDHYNDHCPIINPITNERNAVGCFPLAMAQVLNYHRNIGHPEFNHRDDAYEYEFEDHRGNDATVKIDDFHDTYRDFPSFHTLSRHLLTVVEAYRRDVPLTNDEEAYLCVAAGFASEAMYDNRGTAAYTGAVHFGKFGYNADEYRKTNWFEDFYFEQIEGDDYEHIDFEFWEILQQDMQRGRPAILALGAPGEDHAVVVDGYNTDDEYHLNLGWQDTNLNIWYSLPDEFPEDFNEIKTAVCGIVPGIEYEPVHATISGNITVNIIDDPAFGITQDLSNVEIDLVDTEIIARSADNEETISINADGSFSNESIPPGIYDIEFYRDKNHINEPVVIDANVIIGPEDLYSRNYTVDIRPYAFLNVCNETLSQDPVFSTSARWGDYDNDGNMDLFVGNYDVSDFCLQYHNNGNGTFSPVANNSFTNTAGETRGLSLGDYNNDGNIDIFQANIRSSNLFPNNGGGNFGNPDHLRDCLGSATNACWGDYDNDGFLDLFVTNSSDPYRRNSPGEENLLFLNIMNNNFRRQFRGHIVTTPSRSTSACWADFDNDGYQDLFVANSRGENNFMYRNLGNLNFEFLDNIQATTDGGDSRGVCVADYDNNGTLDLFVANDSGEDNFLYENIGGADIFALVPGGVVVSDGGNSTDACWGDYDNDGDLDLFVANYGTNFLYQNNGDTTFTSITDGDLVNNSDQSNSACWADYDNDGYLDLFVANRGNNVLYRNHMTGNNWTKIKCTMVSNRFGIGAKIYLTATIFGQQITQMRSVEEQTTHFGLGDAQGIDNIRVEWPGGRVTEYNGPWNISGREITLRYSDNSAPVANDILDPIVTDEDSPLEVDIELDAFDPDGDDITCWWEDMPEHGVLARTDNPMVFRYRPTDPNYHGEDSFTYIAEDEHDLRSNTATVMIDIRPVNDRPIARNDRVNLNRGERRLAINVLDNDSDVDGDELRIESVTDPQHNRAEVNGNTILYTRIDNNFSGTESFNYTITDGHGGRSTARISVNVISDNRAPRIRYFRAYIWRRGKWRRYYVRPNGTLNVRERERIYIYVRATDRDRDRLSYGMRNMPPGSNFNRRRRRFYWRPSRGSRARSPYDITFTVSDGRLSDEKSMTIKVR